MKVFKKLARNSVEELKEVTVRDTAGNPKTCLQHVQMHGQDSIDRALPLAQDKINKAFDIDPTAYKAALVQEAQAAVDKITTVLSTVETEVRQDKDGNDFTAYNEKAIQQFRSINISMDELVKTQQALADAQALDAVQYKSDQQAAAQAEMDELTALQTEMDRILP